MADNSFSDSYNFKEACCIDAGRVFDSCCDRDCVEDLRCFFTAEGQSLIESALSVKMRSAEVLNVYINVEPVNFNRGFYSCDLSFLFLITFDVYTTPQTCPIQVRGVCSFCKRVILYGSEGNVKIFSNDLAPDTCNIPTSDFSLNTPRCVVQCVEPIALGCHIGQIRDCCENPGIIDASITEILGGPIVTVLPPDSPAVYVTLGIFSVVQLIRNVQMLIPVYDYCIPEKQCNDATDQPCDIFKRIKFPTEDFFPPCSYETNIGCGCSDDND